MPMPVSFADILWAPKSPFHEFLEAICLEVVYQMGIAGRIVMVRFLRLFEMRRKIENHARSREYIPGATMWHRYEEREGLLYLDQGDHVVIVDWRWPEEIGLRAEDKWDVCLSHERHDPFCFRGIPKVKGN